MTPQEYQDLLEGKEWFEELVTLSRNVKVPKKFSSLKRRIGQIVCVSHLSVDRSPHFFKILFRYLLGIGYLSLLSLKSYFSKNKKLKFSIWDSDISAHVTPDIFFDFVSSKQVVILDADEFLFIKSNRLKTSSSKISLSQSPTYEALLYCDIKTLDLLILFKDQLRNYFRYITLFIICREAKPIFKDFLLEPLITLYQKRGLQKFYRTNSDINTQEFWCESINFNTVWYSINSRSFQVKNQDNIVSPEYPVFSFAHFGTSWTWNQFSKDWLNTIYPHTVNVVGPITLSPLIINSEIKHSPKQLLIFDVTPVKDSHYRSQLFPKGYKYYTEETCRNFIKDILSITKDLDIVVSLKPKRKQMSSHSQEYIDYIFSCTQTYKNFKLLPPETNLFEEIGRSDLIITIPLSSPYDIAKFMKVPAFYYDPSGDLDFLRMGYPTSEYVNTPSELKSRILSFF